VEQGRRLVDVPASLDDVQRKQAREEISRQVGDPPGPFTLVGRAWAAKITRA